MNTDIIQGKWEQIKGDITRRWGKLTDNHLTEIDGRRAKLLGIVQESYGLAFDEAERQVAEWEKTHAA